MRYSWLLVFSWDEFQPELCNVCHDLLQNTMSFNDVSIVSVIKIDYRTHFGIRVKMKPQRNGAL